MPNLRLSLRDLVGNQAVQRSLENKTPLIELGEPERRALQRELHPRGIWHTQALPRIKPEDLQGVIPLQLPPEFDLSSLQAPASRDDEFVRVLVERRDDEHRTTAHGAVLDVLLMLAAAGVGPRVDRLAAMRAGEGRHVRTIDSALRATR